MNTFSQLFSADKVGKKITPHQLMKAVIKHRLDIAVWADKDLIEWWLKLSNQPQSGMQNEEALRMGESLIRAIRKELGKDDSEIETGHLIALFLKESPEEVTKKIGS